MYTERSKIEFAHILAYHFRSLQATRDFMLANLHLCSYPSQHQSLRLLGLILYHQLLQPCLNPSYFGVHDGLKRPDFLMRRLLGSTESDQHRSN